MKKIKHNVIFAAAVFCLSASSLSAQRAAKAKNDTQVSENLSATPGAEQVKKATEWVASLNLTDGVKAQRVIAAIATHLTTVRDWHNAHPPATVPAGINPSTGNKLSDLDRQIIASSAMPAPVHGALMNVLNAELTPQEVEAVLDKYTVGKVAFTLKGYHAIVPDLTSEEEAKITAYLKQAREQAIDYKNMKEISAIFEIYKTKCEQYLNSNGRNWRELFKAYVDKVKKEKAAKGGGTMRDE